MTGACVGCCNSKCRASFHLPCIFEAKGLTIFSGAFDAFCSHHRPSQDLKSRLETYNDDPPECCICLFSIFPEEDEAVSNTDSLCKSLSPDQVTSPSSTCRKSVTIAGDALCPVLTPAPKQQSQSNNHWEVNTSTHGDSKRTPLQRASQLSSWKRRLLHSTTPSKTPGRATTTLTPFDAWSHGVIHGECCRPAWMHRDCAAGYARSAGLHHVKCPLCFNRDTFISTLLKFGVWVPDRDASWELEPGAFAYSQGPPVVGELAAGGGNASSEPNDETHVVLTGTPSDTPPSPSSRVEKPQIDGGSEFRVSPMPPPPRRRRRNTVVVRRPTATPGPSRTRRSLRRLAQTPLDSNSLVTDRLPALLECSFDTPGSSEKENRRPSPTTTATTTTDPLTLLPPSCPPPTTKARRRRAQSNFAGARLKQTVISSFFEPVVAAGGDTVGGDVRDDPEIERTNALFRSMMNVDRTPVTKPSAGRYSLRSSKSGTSSLL
ncbi:unnamed protein product [Mesocestoides corti]|nr:unnamed protein product [Mesocestoides corti]